ncbi:hypothetical protein R1flu_023541 [Riccia fluitans]|uniref:Ribosomal protein S12 n=1 Tax=Riccia fluitans TaxID=41844 RepID=A0ABD1XSU7_9MARC
MSMAFERRSSSARVVGRAKSFLVQWTPCPRRSNGEALSVRDVGRAKSFLVQQTPCSWRLNGKPLSVRGVGQRPARRTLRVTRPTSQACPTSPVQFTFWHRSTWLKGTIYAF